MIDGVLMILIENTMTKLFICSHHQINNMLHQWILWGNDVNY